MNISIPTLLFFWIGFLSFNFTIAQPYENSRPKLSAEAFYQRGVEFHKTGQFDIAVNYYSEALVIETGHQAARYNRGLAYFELEKYNKALLDFDWLININPNDIALYEQRARIRFLLDDAKGAIEDYSLAMEHAPTSILLVNRGMAESQLSNFQQALIDFDNALEKQPLDAEAFANKGDVYFAMEDFHNAIQNYTEALQIYPEDERCYNNRANAYAKLGNNEEALSDYDKAIEIQPNSYIHVNRGFFWLDNDKLEKALADFLESSRLNFNNANAFYGIALVKMEKGNLDEALENMDKAIHLDRNNELFLNVIANISFQKKEYEDAIYEWEQVLSIDPENEEALNGIQSAKAAIQDTTNDEHETWGEYLEKEPMQPFAFAATTNESFEEENYEPIPTYDISLTEELPFPEHEEVYSLAQEVFIPKGIPETKAPKDVTISDKTLFELAPSALLVENHPVPDEMQILKRANSLLEAARYQEAIDEFTILLNINPGNAQALTGRGKAHYKLLDYKKALADLSTAISVNPDLTEAYFTRGHLYFDLKNTYKAIDDFEVVLKRSPDFAEAYFMRGVCYSNLSSYDIALKDFESCLHLDPNNLKALNNRATIKFITGNIFESIEDYNKAIKRFPYESTLYANRAKAKEHLGLYEAAFRDVEMALSLAPNHVDYHFLRGVIHHKLIDYANAIDDITFSIDHSNVPFAEFYYRRALSYHFNGNLNLAIHDYAEALLLNPENAEAFFNRAIAYKDLGNKTQACQDLYHAAALNLDQAKTYLIKYGCKEK